MSTSLLKQAMSNWWHLAEARCDILESGFNPDHPLCEAYLEEEEDRAACQGCPIRTFTGKPRCNGTPWTKARDVLDSRRPDPNALTLEEREILFETFLFQVSCLPEGESWKDPSGKVWRPGE
jgi:hypothetical protein